MSRRVTSWAVASAVAAAATACGASPATSPAPAREEAVVATPEVAEPTPIRRIDLAMDDPNGLSGLTADDAGTLWAVPETDRALVRLVDDGVDALVTIVGLPEDVDAEGLSWLGGGRFLVGTESTDASRTSDGIFFLSLEGDEARVTGRADLPYAELSVRPTANAGIEGMCADGGIVVLAVEPTSTRDGMRITSVARGDVEAGTFTGHDLALTTETGKISALACRKEGPDMAVLAVERHFEVMRVLRFRVGEVVGDAPIVPDVLVDLAGRLAGDPNLEGLAIDGDDLVMITDNHYGERSGPNELVRLPRKLSASVDNPLAKSKRVNLKAHERG